MTDARAAFYARLEALLARLKAEGKSERTFVYFDTKDGEMVEGGTVKGLPLEAERWT